MRGRNLVMRYESSSEEDAGLSDEYESEAETNEPVQEDSNEEASGSSSSDEESADQPDQSTQASKSASKQRSNIKKKAESSPDDKSDSDQEQVNVKNESDDEQNSDQMEVEQASENEDDNETSSASMESERDGRSESENERESDGNDDESSSDDAISQTDGKITLEYVPVEKHTKVPHVLYFPKAPPSVLASQGDASSEERMRIKVLHGKERHFKQRVILADTDRMEYYSTNFGATTHDINRYVIGILDKGRKRMRLVESSHLFAMEQNIKDFDDTVAETRLDYRQASAALVESFGSKRSRTSLIKNIRNKVTEDNVNVDSFDRISSHIRDKSASLPDTPESGQDLSVNLETMPPFDASGATPSQVYSVNEILEEDLMEELVSSSKDLFTDKKLDLDKLIDMDIPDSIIDHFHGLSWGSVNAKQRIASAFYLLYLIRFKLKWSSRIQGIRKIAAATNIPENIVHHLLRTFTTRQAIRENIYKNVINHNDSVKLLNYIFVMHLILSDYNMRLTQLMRDLNLDFKRVRMHALKLGCAVTGGARSRRFNGKAATAEMDNDEITEMVAVLDCPVVFPDFTAKRAKKKSAF